MTRTRSDRDVAGGTFERDDRHAAGASPRGRAAGLLAVGLVTAFWLVFIVIGSVVTYYDTQEVRFFRSASFGGVLSIMQFELYARFSPLVFGPVGWLDTHLLVPLLGLKGQPAERLAVAGRLVWLHPLLLAADCLVAAEVAWRLWRDVRLAVAVVLLIGLSDAIPFEMHFVSTLVCYVLQISAVLAAYNLVRLATTRSRRAAVGVAICVAAALATWEQGLNLALVATVVLAVGIVRQRPRARDLARLPETLGLGLVLLFTAGYLGLRLRAGSAEALSTDREASYFFSYRTGLPMVDDLLLNISELTLQSFRQFLPFPPLSLAVLSGTDMNKINTYNLSYAQYPNMFYRMMGLWYAGLAFAGTLALLVHFSKRAIRDRGIEGQAALVGLCMFFGGFAMHLPIMHHDYFYIPGYAVGYKVSISYVGFVILVALAARSVLRLDAVTRLSRGRRGLALSMVTLLFCAAALSRAVLGRAAQSFPW